MGKRQRSTSVRRSSGVSGADALREILKTEKHIKQIRYHLGMTTKKVEENGEERREWVMRDNAMLNEEGIDANVGFARFMVDKNQALSNHTPGQIQNLMTDIHKTVARDNIEAWDEYGIENRPTLDKVVAGVTNNIFSIYNRSIDAMTLKKITESAEQKSEVHEQEDDSGWGL